MTCSNIKITGKKVHFLCRVRRDQFGRIVLDTCKSDEDHLKFSTAKEGDDRARCRMLVEEYFDKMVDKEGLFTMDISLDEHYTVPDESQQTD